MQTKEGKGVLIDIRLCRESVRFASNVDVVRVLVHPHVVNGHDRREGQVFEINKTEVGRDPQVENHVLKIVASEAVEPNSAQGVETGHSPSALVELVLVRCSLCRQRQYLQLS